MLVESSAFEKVEKEMYESKIDSMDLSLQECHNMNQKMLIQIKHLKDYVDSLKKNSAKLVEENENLKLTLGADYYNLTPRPNWPLIGMDLRSGLVEGNRFI